MEGFDIMAGSSFPVHVSSAGDTFASDDEDATAGGDQQSKGKKGSSQWHRMKWTSSMVKLLITAVSYTGEDSGAECSAAGGRKKFAVLQKKGKWKAISKVMGKRGCFVSPQQCEDKFNDLNKRYKRLTDILGKGTSCQVVENPLLLDRMDISDKLKDDARKILSSKHLFYEEMCSYHNGNRNNLPPDPALQRALQLAMRVKEDHDPKGGADDEDHSDNSDDGDDEDALKRTRTGEHGEFCFGNSSSSQDGTRISEPRAVAVDINQTFVEGLPPMALQTNHGSNSHLLIEKQRLRLEIQMLELQKQRRKWERFSARKDRELRQMRMENERMKLENDRMELELRHKELDIERSSARNSHGRRN